MRWIVAALAAIIGLTAPARAAVFYSQTVAASGGEAIASDFLYAPQLFESGSTWVTVDQGQFSAATWLVEGELTKLWWDEFGSIDENDNFVPVLTGNEYIYGPTCTSTLAAPVCGTTPLRTTLQGNVLRIDFTRPPDYDFCTPTFVVAGDCAEFYAFGLVRFDLVATDVATAATFTFFDSNPVPEPAVWTLLIAGFATAGTAMRRRRSAAACVNAQTSPRGR